MLPFTYESSPKGRMFICLVSLLVASYIRHSRDTKPELTKAFPSMASILEEMQVIRSIEHDEHRKFITPFVGDQITICDAFNFEIPEGCRPTDTSRKLANGKRGRPPKQEVETSWYKSLQNSDTHTSESYSHNPLKRHGLIIHKFP